LFVVLFQGFGPGHNHSPTAGSGTATVTATLSPTPIPEESYHIPALALSNPQVVYRFAPDSGAAGQLIFQASTDGGASWHNFSLPAQNSSGPEPSIFVSPLDPQTVFVSLGGTFANNTCTPKQGVGSNSTLSGGDYMCVIQYLSQDGGAHWTRLQLPSNNVLGDFRASLSHASADNVHALLAQGTRLYAALVPSIPSYLSGSNASAAPRLVSSDDGGRTWQMIDQGLPLASDTLCDVVPAPTGSMLFAIVGKGCPEVATSVSLWRSDDAGAHWSKAAQLPDLFEYGMVAVQNGNA